MGYEVDFLRVGDESRSGDAIAFRFGNLFGARQEQTVVVIDGGFQQSGDELVKHIRYYYMTDVVDLVISTHPDQDHASGLSVVLEELTVGQLWMHKPWEHADGMAKLFKNVQVSDKSVRDALKKSLDDAYALDFLAKSKGIPVIEPFAGLADATKTLCVLGPSLPFYESLLPDFRGTQVPIASFSQLVASIYTGAKNTVTKTFETWDKETLGDDGVTSAENNSSVILLANFDKGHQWLFTGDAGVPALVQAADLLDRFNIRCNMIQVPHHGSRRNVSPAILDRLIGPRTHQWIVPHKKAYVSAAKDGAPKHPSRRVTNAFLRRGAQTFGTMNYERLWHHHQAPERGWMQMQQLPFCSEVEDMT